MLQGPIRAVAYIVFIIWATLSEQTTHATRAGRSPARSCLTWACCLLLSGAAGAGAAYGTAAENPGNKINAIIAPDISLDQLALTGTTPGEAYDTNEVATIWSAQNPLPDVPLGQLVFQYQWQRCLSDGMGDPAEGNCTNIPGASGTNQTGEIASYQTSSSDYGKYIRLSLSASNGYSRQAVADTGQLVGKTPTALSQPQIYNQSGQSDIYQTYNTIVQGDTLGFTASPSNTSWWSAFPAIDYETDLAYQWQMCDDPAGLSCQDLAGEADPTSSSYQLLASDVAVGKYLRLMVTASNSTGSSAAYSNVAGPVQAPLAPQIINSPSFSGTEQSGYTLTSGSVQSSGVPAPKVSYQWQRCISNTTTSCSSISGATSSNLSLDYLDMSRWIRLGVTVQNKYGSQTLYSSLSSKIVGAPRLISWSAYNSEDSQEISATRSFVGNNLGSIGFIYAEPSSSNVYQWYRCTDSASISSCSAITGATNGTYTLVSDDAGRYIRLSVAASNQYGSSQVWSNASKMVYEPPSNTALPTIVGATNNGSTLTASNGSWSGTPSPSSYSYEWLRCWSGSCSVIAGAIDSTYQLQDVDMGRVSTTIKVRVTATSAAGNAIATSVATAAITGAPRLINNSQGPLTLGGFNPNGWIYPLKVNDGSGDTMWYANPQPVVGNFSTYGIARCPDGSELDSSVLYQTAVPSGCIQVTASTAGNSSGYSTDTYALSSSDVGWRIAARSRVTTSSGTTTVWTRATSSPVYPNVGGTAQVGSTLSIGVSPNWGATYSYRWQSCNSSLSANSSTICTDLSPGASSSYTAGCVVLGKYLRIRVNVSYGAFSGSATSATVGPVANNGTC